jgi:DtxR family transcriptional regulator, iron-dependent repressor
MGDVSDLIDTTEMYLRTIFELTEEGVRPMRARIAERLGQSGPTVSQTVARMQRDGLVELDQDDRHLVLTPEGADLATRVMRKHRLAECLLVDVIGLPWEAVHAEACRWEHVMSEAVERRLVALLGHPSASPFGNPIPGLVELTAGRAEAGVEPGGPLPGQSVGAVAVEGEAQSLAVLRIGETLQSDEAMIARLREVGATPGGRVDVVRVGDRVRLAGPGEPVDLTAAQAAQVIVAGR